MCLFFAMIGLEMLLPLIASGLAMQRTPLKARYRLVQWLGWILVPSILFMLYVSDFDNVTPAEWREEAIFGWVSVLDQGIAGAMALPLWLVAQAFFSYGVVTNRLNGKCVFGALLALIAVSGWTTINQLLLVPDSGFFLFVGIPASPFIAYVWLAIILCRRGLRGRWLWLLPWVALIGVTAVSKISLAKGIYDMLSPTPPPPF